MKKIYLIAPSIGVTTTPYKERYEESLKYFKNLSYNIIEGKNIHKATNEMMSNTKEERVEEIYDAFASDADYVISVGGHELELEILEVIDLDKILKNKIFIGYSDNTYLNYLLTTQKNFKTIIGFNFPKFYLKTKERYDLLRLMNFEDEFESYEYYEDKNIKLEITETPKYTLKTNIKTINYQEPFITYFLGGTIDCITNILGTEFDKTIEYTKDKPTTLLLESCDLNSIEFRRQLIRLKLAGWFKYIKAIMIGRPLINDTIYSYTKEDHIKEILTPLNIPIIYDIDFGHTNPQMPFMTNRKARVGIINKRLHIKYLE